LSATAIEQPRSRGAAIYRATRWSTRIEIVLTEPSALVEAVTLLHRELDEVESVASRFRSDSELSALGRAVAVAGGRPVPISPALAEALAVGLRAGALSEGMVDVTVGGALRHLGYDQDFALLSGGVDGELGDPHPVPGWGSIDLDLPQGTVAMPPGVVIDLGATAKAWAADRVAAVVESTVGCGVLVALGGDLAVRGAPEEGFIVGVADICGDTDAPISLAVDSGGLATSGVGRRHWMLGGHRVHHLIDPTTSRPVETPWRTVSVAAASCVDANTASTAAMVRGAGAVEWLSDRRLPSRLVRHDGSVVVVGGWLAQAGDLPR
jgi:thiamine biosynthesis lipoprotein ApbE